MGEVQLPDALTMMAQLGISPVEPSRDQMKRLVDKAKNRVIVPQRTQPQSRPGSTSRLPMKG